MYSNQMGQMAVVGVAGFVGGGYSPMAAGGYGQMAGLSGLLMGGYGGSASMNGYGNCGGYGQYGNCGGFGSFNTLGGMCGYFNGGIAMPVEVPVYEDRIYQEPYQYTVTERQQVTTHGAGQMWDVWFDTQDGKKTTQRSPIVLDLNGNGKPDITGQNILGDGKITGDPVLFDIDPSKNGWDYKSVGRRPGHGAPDIPDGRVVFADGTQGTYDARGKKLTGNDGKEIHIQGGNSDDHGTARFFDKNGNLVGELRPDTEKKQWMYHWGNKEPREKTEWLAKNGGDGMLVWDVNKDGNIASSKELFGEFDVNGEKKFKDGYEKLAFYFDKNKDGKVEGAELEGLQVWKDANGDAKVDAGELQELSQHNITSLNVANVNRADMSSTYGTTTTAWQDVPRTVTGYNEVIRHELTGYRTEYQWMPISGVFAGLWGANGGYGNYGGGYGNYGGGYGNYGSTGGYPGYGYGGAAVAVGFAGYFS